MRTHKQEPSWDHQAQVSVIATRHSLMTGNAPQGLQSATRNRVGQTVCLLQVQLSGKPAGAMSHKQAQSGCRLRPHQLLGGS
jgi:hypothetical protein